MTSSYIIKCCFSLILSFIFLTLANIQTMTAQSDELTDQLLRESYVSSFDDSERDYFLYLPQGYDPLSDKKWPVILFLHGNGERGNGKDELDYVKHHGPLYEAWVQKRNLPFIIIAPQLHMMGQDTVGKDYISNRRFEDIPQRLNEGTPQRSISQSYGPMRSVPVAKTAKTDQLYERFASNGWNLVADDVRSILLSVLKNHQADDDRVVLSGISYGGVGTWQIGSFFPELFAALNPIVGFGHPDLVEPIAEYQIPVWCFAGGRDYVVDKSHFYAGLNKLESLSSAPVRFTVHEDMGHDTWKRVYAGEDIYQWMLNQKRNTQ